MAIKVLHITDVEVDDYHLKNLSEYLEGRGYEFSFVTFRSADSDLVRGMNSRGHKALGLDAIGKSSYPRTFRKLGKLFNEIDPDIVHTNLFEPSLIGLTVAKRQARATVLTRHHSDALHNISSPIKRRVYLALDNYISRKADHIIAPSRMVHDILVDREGVPSEKVSVIPYSQTTTRFAGVTPEVVRAKRNELGMNDQLSLVCVSRLYHGKGHRFLFEALAPLIHKGLNARLYLVGRGTYRSELESMADKLGITPAVTFLGWRDDTLEIIGSADIIVHPSLEDALSQALIESLMLARPIVATDISGAADTLDGGKYGRLVRPRDAVAFRVALEETINDLEGARSVALEGRQYILDYMGAKSVSERYAIIYEATLAKSRLKN